MLEAAPQVRFSTTLNSTVVLRSQSLYRQSCPKLVGDFHSQALLSLKKADSEHAARLPDPSTNSFFPLYYQSYTPQASTSKVTISAPPASGEITNAARPPSSLSKRERRARRSLTSVTRCLANITQVHLSQHAEANRVYTLLSKLANTVPTPEDAQSKAVYESKAVASFCDAFLAWLGHLSASSSKSSSALLLRCAEGYKEILPAIMGHTSGLQGTRHSQSVLGETEASGRISTTSSEPRKRSPKGVVADAVQAEQLRLLKILPSRLTAQDLCSFLAGIPPSQWLSLPSKVLDALASAVLVQADACDFIHRALPRRASSTARVLGQHPRVHQLHGHLFQQQMSEPQSYSRMFGPAPAQRASYSGLKFILSSMILSEKLQHEKCTRTMHKKHLAVIREFRKRHLPPDRQVMAAILHLASLSDITSVTDLEQDGTLGWLWREWTVLRENEPAPSTDDALLVGFLEVVGRVASPEYIESIADQENQKTDRPLWMQQAFGIAQNQAALNFGVDKSTMQYRIEQDVPPIVNKRLLRSLAVAAIQLGYYDTAFACLLDTRCQPRHIIPVLHVLGTAIDTAAETNPRLSQVLADAISKHLLSISSRIPISLSVKHATQLADFISALARQDQFEAAETFLRIPRSPLHFGEGTLCRLVKTLSRTGGSQVLARLYERLPASKWPSSLLREFLRSSNSELSSDVWQYVQTRPDFSQGRFLEARLWHHLRHPNLQYARACQEYETAVSASKLLPSSAASLLLLDLHIRAGSGRRAIKVYNQLRESDVSSKELDVRFLKIAGLPSWAGYRKRGPRSQLSRLALHLDQLVADGTPLDPLSARYLVLQSLRWAEMNEEAIWAILKSATDNSAKLDWYSDLKPLFTAVKHAFRKRGNHDAETEVEQIMSKVRKEKSVCRKKGA